MRDFTCPKCGQHLTFENSLCLSCGSRLAYSSDKATMVLVDEQSFSLCANSVIAQCNWLIESGSATSVGGLCASCRLTRTRPSDSDVARMARFAVAENAKRRLVAELKRA